MPPKAVTILALFSNDLYKVCVMVYDKEFPE